MGRYMVGLVGESNYQDAVRRLSPGDPVSLRPEPDNPHDPRAIVAKDATGATIGYVARDSWLTAAMLDDRVAVSARVREVSGGDAGRPDRGVVLDVLTGQDAGAPRPAPAAPAPPARKGPHGCLIAAGIVLALFVVGSILPAPETPPGEDPSSAEVAAAARVVTAEELRAAYAANEVAAQQVYGGGPVELRGTIAAITLDVTDDPVIQFATAEPYDHVAANFGEAEAGAVAALAKGQEATVRCLEVREVIGTPVLGNCALVD